MTEDEKLLIRLKDREQAALEEAIHRYGGYLSAVVSRTLGEYCVQEDLEELVSDTFVALWQNAEKLRDDSSLKYWLAVVARNAALKHRKHLRWEEPLEDNEMFPETGIFIGPEEQREQARLVREAVESLDAEDKELFLRHYFWRQTIRQIAEETGKNESTIKTRLLRGREKLRQKLIKEDCTS